MDKIAETKEWFLNYIRHRDIVEKTIINIKESKDKIFIEYKNKTTKVIIMPLVNGVDGLLEELNASEEVTLVTLNNKKNLRSIIGVWEKLSAYSKFRIMFVNPKENEKWIINPYTHSKISPNIEKGLKGLFETINEVK